MRLFFSPAFVQDKCQGDVSGQLCETCGFCLRPKLCCAVRATLLKCAKPVRALSDGMVFGEKGDLRRGAIEVGMQEIVVRGQGLIPTMHFNGNISFDFNNLLIIWTINARQKSYKVWVCLLVQAGY